MNEEEIIVNEQVNDNIVTSSPDVEIQLEEQQQNENIETVATPSIELEDIEPVSITMQEIELSGGSSGITTHSALNGRDSNDQHPISAITGLRAELDEIERLKTVVSNGKNLAQYYLWGQDEEHENSVGKFVSLVSGTNTLKICNGTTDDVFGVIITEIDAAFVGLKPTTNQSDYGLVCFTGDVKVLRANDVAVGDYVLPNTLGVASKSTYGYKVTEVSNDSGALYATIDLNTNGKILSEIYGAIDTLDDKVDANNTNVTNAINAVNALATSASQTATSASTTATQASQNAQSAVSTANTASSTATSAQTNAALAKEIAQSAVTAAETAKNTAVSTANSAVASVNTLSQTMAPITTYGASQLIYTIQNDLATNVELQAVSDDVDDALTATIKNAKDLKTLSTVTKKYTVGEYPQSIGLTQVEAEATLKSGMVFAPIENYPAAPAETLFYKGYSYTWNGTGWDQSATANVTFSQIYITGGGSASGTFNTGAIKSISGTKNYGFTASVSNIMTAPTVSDIGVLSWTAVTAGTQDEHTGDAAGTASVSWTAAALGTAATTAAVTGISGGSITPVTKYMKKTTTAAGTGTVGITTTAATKAGVKVTTAAAGKGTVTISGGVASGTASVAGVASAVTLTAAFYGCTGLESIIIPDTVVTILHYAFYGCTGLTSISIPNSTIYIG